MARPSIPRSEIALVATCAFLVFTRVAGFSLVLPGFREYGETLTSNTTLIGTALGAYGLTFALAQLPLGMLSDRIGRKPVLVVGSVLFIAGSAWAAMAPTIGQLLGARLLQGLGAIGSTALAAVGETVPESRRTSAMAVVGIPAGIGFVAGLIGGAALGPALGVPGLFWLTAALGVLALVPVFLIRFLPPAPKLDEAGWRRSLGMPVMSLAIAGFATNYALTTVLFFLPEVRPRLLVATLLTAFLIMAVVVQKVDKKGAATLPIAVALVFLAAAAPAYALSAELVWVLVAGVAFFAAHSVLSATLPSQVSRLAGRSGGRGHGIQTVVAYTGTFIAGPIAGFLAADPEKAFVILGAIVVIAGILVAANLGRATSPSFISEPS